MKRFLIIVSIIILISCKNKKENLSLANEHFVDYLVTKKKSHLDSSYQYLKSGGYLIADNINKQNVDLITTILLYMKKYQDLELLLKENNKMAAQEKEFILNLTLALKNYKVDSIKAKEYIRNNLIITEKEIVSNPFDSTSWVQYCAMRIYLVGKNQAIQEVDSIKSINNFSNSFYENFLVEFIREYPNELMFD